MERSELKHGDVLLFERGSKHGTLLGRIIRLLTGSRYTHSAIVLENRSGERFIAEQSGHCAMTRLDDFVFHRPEKVTVWRNETLRWNGTLAMVVAWTMVNTPYGVGNLFEILFQHTMGRLVKNWKWKPVFLPEDRKKCTCSGLVAKIMFTGTLNPPAFTRYSTIVEPDDYADHNFVQVGVIHDGD